MALNIVNDHNGIIQQETDGNDYRRQSDDIEFITKYIHGRKGKAISEGDRDGGQQRHAQVGQDKKNNGDGHDNRIPQGIGHVGDAGSDNAFLGIGKLKIDGWKLPGDGRKGFFHRGDGGGDMPLLRA